MPDTLILYPDDASTSTGLNISNYVDVHAGGINLGDGPQLAGVFGEPVGVPGAGGAFIGERVTNRTVLVSLQLTAATRDALHELVRTINGHLQGTAPNLAWTAEGATSPTFIRILHGRLLGAERYDYWRERTLVAKRLLECVCLPYGEGGGRIGSGARQGGFEWWATGAGMAAASGVMGSNPGRFALPSVGGDAPAGMRIAVGFASSWGSAIPTSAANVVHNLIQWGIAPFEFDPGRWNALRLAKNQGTLYGPTVLGSDGVAPLGGAWMSFSGTHQPSGPVWEQLNGTTAPGTTLQPGRYQMYAIARVFSSVDGWGKVRARFNTGAVQWVSPAGTLSGGAPSMFQAIDLGDFFTAGALSVPPEVAWERGTGASFTASPAFHLAGFVVLPKGWGAGRMTRFDTGGLTGGYTFDGLYPEAGPQLRALMLHSNPATANGGEIMDSDVPVAPNAASGSPTVGATTWWAYGFAVPANSFGVASARSLSDQDRLRMGVTVVDRYLFAR